MVRRFKSIEAYQRALLKRPKELLPFNVSPGWACAMLDASRARVHAMIVNETLDSVRTEEGIVLLRRAEIVAYKRLRDQSPPRQHARIGMAWMKAKREREKKTAAPAIDTNAGTAQTRPE